MEQIDILVTRLHWTRQLPVRALGAVVGAVVGYALGTWDPFGLG